MAIQFCNRSFQFLLILLTLNSFINLSSARTQISDKTSIEFNKTSCSSTTYPELCYESLSNQASMIQTNPQIIAIAALNVTLENAKSTSTKVVWLSNGHGLQPREMQAVKACVDELSDTIDELRKSMSEMGQFKGSNNVLVINKIQKWVSAALADESTCTDGFEGNSPNEAKTAVRSNILTIAHLTSNALALVNNYASKHG